jgi:hypothetical protein
MMLAMTDDTSLQTGVESDFGILHKDAASERKEWRQNLT